MSNKNSINKIKRIVKKIFAFFITVFLILFLYSNLTKEDYNVDKGRDLLTDSREDDCDSAERDSEKVNATLNINGLPTPAPPTPAPPTPAPPTPAPFTPAPPTPAPPTPAPSTPAPPTSAPPTPAPFTPAPDLIGKDETTAISICTQNGYTYNIEYYLGGNATVISQSPNSSESIEPGGNITINIGIPQNDFSNKLLALINGKRRAAGLNDLSFSEQLNTACNILAQENVNSVDCTRPDGNHWSSVLWENDIWLNEGIFTTRNNITSLSDANGRIKYSGNSYGEGNLLTPSFTVIGMAYSTNNMLVIIIGS